MKGILLPAAIAVLGALSVPSWGQQSEPAQADADQSEAAVSPERWYYQQQLERYDDPKVAVRRNAEFRAQQRMARLETLKWYGLSNARPAASPTPFTSMYSPAWQANWHRPYAWYMSGRPTIVITNRAQPGE